MVLQGGAHADTRLDPIEGARVSGQPDVFVTDHFLHGGPRGAERGPERNVQARNAHWHHRGRERERDKKKEKKFIVCSGISKFT